jgi:two-component system, chemotaxis family, CheB/CheR fusion protein
MTDDFEDSSQAEPDSSQRLSVVGLGASAGGIKALKEFFARVDPQSGCAYVVILHLSPEYDSRLAEVLQSDARIGVAQVTGSTRIQPNHVYVVPPNRSMAIADGHLSLSELTRAEQRRSPVDVFFRALADAQGAGAVCVILSGTGPNGSQGLKRVKEYGGLVLAQDPAEAEYDDMPRSAIATGLVDVVLPVAQMPERIATYFDHLRTSAAVLPAGAGATADSDALQDVLTLLRVRTGHDFSNYKAATLRRRVERRLHVRNMRSLGEYAQLIRHEPDEAVALMRELLISVTHFFRDADTWELLGQKIIPRLFVNKTAQDQVRAWVPGCATGEEAYSLAMLLTEHAFAAADRPSIQVFATDLDAAAIGIAREGLYSEADVAEIPEERLKRFFIREPTGYRVRRELREMVLFAPHNVIKDPPFSHLDLISCRNVLIYLNRAIQGRVVETFHFALRPGGYLLLGTSETPEGTQDLFFRIDNTAHIYESRTVTSRLALSLREPIAVLHQQPRHPGVRPVDRISPGDLHMRILEQYAPPSLIVTEEHNIVHVSEQAGRYLLVPGGEPSRDLLLLARPELRPELRTALHQAAKERTAVEVRGVAVSLDDGDHRVTILVRPVLREGDPARGFFLVLFRQEDGDESAADTALTLNKTAEPIASQLEEELSRLRAQLRTTVEQYEMQVEEANASNEELQAANEELRSSAEELETGKEELQSVNEELSTVNQELKIKIEELGLRNNDFQNLIKATDIGTIFLDRALRVKFSTPRAQEVFNLLDSDIGRPLSDITSNLRYAGIHADVRGVLDRLQSVEREIEADNGRWYLMRLLPYRTADDRIDGVVITFLEITARRDAEQQVRQSEERPRLLIDGAVDYAIFTMTEDGRIDSWNPGAQRMFGYSSAEAIGMPAARLFTAEDQRQNVPAAELEQARWSGRAADDRQHVRKNGTVFYCSGVTTRLGRGGLGFAKIARDLTDQRSAADALQEAHDGLEKRVRQRTDELHLEAAEHVVAKDQIMNLLRRIVRTQEDERGRIARDLHDHLGQQLTTLRLGLERHQQECRDGRPDGEIAVALEVTRRIGHDINFLAWELRPRVLDEFGLSAALPRFVKEWSTHVGIDAEFRLAGFDEGQLDRDAEVAFYRIAQEALNNISKHAHASRVDMVLSSFGGDVVLVIEDDGVGFDVSTARHVGLGLAGMRERAALVGATLELESSPGKGTAVFLRRPIDLAANGGS